MINLTKNELCFIDDCLTMYRDIDPNEEPPRLVYRNLAPSAGTAASPEFITKIGSALVELHERQSSGATTGLSSPLDFVEEELWLIREIANSNARYNDELVGYNLKIKIHRELREIYANEVMGDIPISSMDDPAYDKTKFEVYEFFESDES